MPTTIRGITFEELIDELGKEAKKKRKEGSHKDKELEELIRKHGIVEGTLIWIGRHPDKMKEIVEKEMAKESAELRNRMNKIVEALSALGKELEKHVEQNHEDEVARHG